MQKIEKTFKSNAGDYDIVYRIYPCLNAHAIVHIVHGMIDHQDRYLELISYLHQHQFMVVSHDHIGHGLSVFVKEDLGSFKNGTWETLVEDTHTLISLIKQTSNLPYFVFAHSMGSFVLRTYIQRFKDIDGLILSGTINQATGTLAGLTLANSLVKIKGRDKCDPIFHHLMFDPYNKHFERRTSADWLTRDLVKVNQYISDPLTRFDFTIGSYKQLLRGVLHVTSNHAFKDIDKQLPILILSGSEDPVGGYGKGMTSLFHKFKKNGFPFVELRLYPGGRHEMFNELNRQEVFEYLSLWIEKRLRAL